MDIGSICDSLAAMLTDMAPAMQTGRTFRRIPAASTLDQSHAGAFASRTFDVRPGAVVELGAYLREGREVWQQVHLDLYYATDPRGVDARTMRYMAGSDAAQLVATLYQPPHSHTWDGQGIQEIRATASDDELRQAIDATGQPVIGLWVQTITAELLYITPGSAPKRRSVYVYDSWTDLEAAAGTEIVDGDMAVVYDAPHVIGTWEIRSSTPVLLGRLRLDLASATTLPIGASGALRPTGTASFSGGALVVVTGGLSVHCARSGAYDLLHVGTHTTYEVPQQAAHWVGEHFSAGALPAASTAGRLAAVVSETTGALVAAYKDNGSAWEELTVPAVQTTSRATAALPQTTQHALFTVAGGKVRVLGITGEVTTQVQAQANNAKIVANPTTGADVDLCAVLDLTGDAVGTMYEITGTFTDALQTATSGAIKGQATPTVVAAGTIDLSCSASSTGAIKWTCHYVAIDSGATVTAA